MSPFRILRVTREDHNVHVKGGTKLSQNYFENGLISQIQPAIRSEMANRYFIDSASDYSSSLKPSSIVTCQ